ncbi:hypothetical protein CVT24_003873 [Panaeolus cyanescens]|uniref:C2 domain-containing protein n=1 Tax=Panaeolus cyanescens TaxID=181874 RepID=A0A409VV41_9AGAR|nr:hypothetical protein CVT24_003873 [Panaeolus cyanescens]
MSLTPREIGTLIVVVLRANHLPNKRHIGKQDPYCLVVVNGEKRRTKAIKRGGQHPEWDEEIRFTLFEDVEDVLARTAQGDGVAAPPLPPPKDDKKLKKIKGGKIMRLACYADDPREPDLIGETEVDLTEVLTKGETDDWFNLTYKDKFAGKVYLELTFWSNEPPPEKKVTKPTKNKEYVGPGTFVPSGTSSSQVPSSNGTYSHSRQSSDVLPSSLRASNSRLDLYVAPYERQRNNQIDTLTQEFSEFGVSNDDRLPPVQATYQPHGTYNGYNNYGGYGYEHQVQEPSVYSYDRPVTPNGQLGAHYHHNSTGSIHSYSSQPYQQSSYEVAPQPPYQQQHSGRGPRHSLPATSSGFMPLQQPFSTVTSHASEPSGFASPLSHTPAPGGYASQFIPQTQPVYPPPLSHTPAPGVTGSYLPHSTSLTFQPQQHTQAYSYPSYTITPSASAPQQYAPPAPQPNPLPPVPNLAVQPFPPAPSPHEALSNQLPVQPPNGHTSRPLPQQPQMVYTSTTMTQAPSQIVQSTQPSPPVPNATPTTQPVVSYSLPVPSASSYSPNHHGPLPIPPPPPPTLPYTSAGGVQLNVPPPPPPPPQRQRRASLPVPPVNYSPSQFQHPPPPPPINQDYYAHSPLPLPPPPPPLNVGGASRNDTYPGPPPKPPTAVDEHGQWGQANGHNPIIHSSPHAY